ncbi:unnamed protein product [Cylindrotheca closterium]|uniref:Uncharacterized protein n=1 Tax=Cylindrotheca closterium TaxID=2856 RepID=A0AAD2FWP1_9STRA|nr:unnamed protein product [Cylindrotheca closterium]
MAPSLSFLLSISLIIQGQGFSSSSTGIIQKNREAESFLRSSNDAAFSAFADSLEEEPESNKEQPWQEKLEDLLDPQTNLADRQILMSELLNSNEEIRESVLDALARRKIDPLLTPTGKRIQDGTRAVVRQLANDILPQLSKSPPKFPPTPQSMEKVGSRLLSVVTSQLQKNIEDLQEDLTDPINRIPQRLSRQAEDFVKEARNVFLEKPEGLQEPSYNVVESRDLYDIRDYESYKVASTQMEEGEDLASTGTAFNSLAAYLFGLNDESRTMAMTTPVTTTSSNEMRFFLTEASIPQPQPESSVEIIDIPSSLLAVRKFTGFVTEGEIARQKDALLQALEMDGVELDVAHGAVVPHIIFQYNPPYTLPIVRRNEIAVPVRLGVDLSGGTSLQQEWSVDATVGEDTVIGEENVKMKVNSRTEAVAEKDNDENDEVSDDDTSPSD